MTTDFRSEVFKLCKKVQRDEIAQMIGKTIHDMSVVVEKKTGETIKDARSDFAYLAKHSKVIKSVRKWSGSSCGIWA